MKQLPIKDAAECSMCPCCGEPWCDECDMHYADCLHPGPHSEQAEKNLAAVVLGRMGGKVKSPAKAAAARENGKKGGAQRQAQTKK